MPLFYHHHIKPKGELGIWEIKEGEGFFREQLDLLPQEEEQVEAIKGRRKVEWLASRYLLHLLSGRQERGLCYKDAFGKPHLADSSYQISMSHSHEMAAVIAAPVLVGIDIQFLVAKIDRIAHKFMRSEELDSLQADTRLEHLHVYWGAKEALYKAYGRKELDFCTHIHVHPFSYGPAGGICSGQLLKEDYQADFEIYYERIQDYMLVYALEK